jgi:hypothetical protein
MRSLAVVEMYNFDTGNDALRDPTSIHAARVEPKLAALLVSHVQ